MGVSPPNLVPPPRARTAAPGSWSWRPSLNFFCRGEADDFTMALLALHALGGASPAGPRFERASSEEDARFVLRTVSGDDRSEDYRLRIREERIDLTATGALGLLQGTRTLLQWLAACPAPEGEAPGRLPCEDIEDGPALARRGVMLDISRDRVPRMDFLRGWIERLAFLKVNEIQLYTEHTFAYACHTAVWQGADPITGTELSELATFCRERGVDLVPNQQSLGHMHRWLKLPDYAHLAECPDGILHPFSTEREPYGLAIGCEDTLPFLAGLYAELLPRCLPPVSEPGTPLPNGLFNVGLDEVADLGRDRSAALLRRLGRKGLYAKHLDSVALLAAEHGRRLQFWADELLADAKAPLVPGQDLPPGSMPLLWGYEADHPWEKGGTALAHTEFYICPGTSSWNSLVGRPTNARANLTAAAQAATAFGAAGMLVTDWGDRGHHQPPPVSDAPLALGLSLAWNPASVPTPADIHAHLDHHVYGAPGLAAAIEACGTAVESPEIGTQNENPPSALLRYAAEPLPHPRMPGLTSDALRSALQRLDAALEEMEGRDERSSEAQLVRSEILWAAHLARAGLRVGLARLAAGGATLPNLPPGERAKLAPQLSTLVTDQGPLWCARSREGGRADSQRRLGDIATSLDPTAALRD